MHQVASLAAALALVCMTDSLASLAVSHSHEAASCVQDAPAYAVVEHKEVAFVVAQRMFEVAAASALALVASAEQHFHQQVLPYISMPA